MTRDGDLRVELVEHLKALLDLGVTELWVPREARRGDADAGPAERVASGTTLSIPEPGLHAVPLFEGPSGAVVLRDGEGEERTAPVLLETLRRNEIGDCRRCPLSERRRTIVFGSGNPDADLMFIGEGPGAEEDEQGLPFVGRAGQLLTRMIESMAVDGRKLRRDEVYIANIVKCRPPGNRDPEPAEIAACEGFLFEQIAIVEPRVIVTLGAFAARTLLRSKAPISALRGRFHEYRGTLLMPTFHPAYVLRNYTEETRRSVYEDLKKAATELERASAGG